MDSVDRDLIQAQLSAYLDGELSPEEVAEVERRLASDPDVRATFDSLRHTVQLIRTLPRHPAPAGVLGDLTAAAERDQLLDPGGASATSRATRWEGVRSLLATAAVVVITVGTGLWFAAGGGDTDHLAGEGTRLAQTKTADPVESHVTLMAPSDSIKEDAPRTTTKQAVANPPAEANAEQHQASVRDSLTRESRMHASPIVRAATHDLPVGAALSEGLTGVEPEPSAQPPSLAPSRKLDEAPTKTATRLDVSSDALGDSLALDDSTPPAPIREPRREHVLPLSFVCAGIADRKACELGLRRYLEVREPSNMVQLDTTPASNHDPTQPPAIVETMIEATPERRRDADKDRAQSPGSRSISARALVGSALGGSVAPASMKQAPSSAAAGYRVRLPASELLHLIDRVSSAAQGEVVPELELGPFTARGRSRIEQLLGDSRYPVARGTHADSETKAATARSAGGESPTAPPHVDADPGTATAGGLGHGGRGGAEHDPTSSGRSVDRLRGGAAGEKAARPARKKRELTGDAARKSKLVADSEPDSAEAGKESSTRTSVEDTWITLVITFVDRGPPVAPVQSQPESSTAEVDGGANDESPVSTTEEVPEDASAAESQPPATSSDRANSSP